MNEEKRQKLLDDYHEQVVDFYMSWNIPEDVKRKWKKKKKEKSH